MPPRKEPASASEQEKEIEVLRLKLEVATMREEIQTLRAVNGEQMEALKENCRLFSKLKPSRDTIRLSGERKMLIAGTQLFRCAAPHGKDKCPCWLLNEGSFGERASRSITNSHGRRATRTQDSSGRCAICATAS